MEISILTQSEDEKIRSEQRKLDIKSYKDDPELYAPPSTFPGTYRASDLIVLLNAPEQRIQRLTWEEGKEADQMRMYYHLPTLKPESFSIPYSKLPAELRRESKLDREKARELRSVETKTMTRAHRHGFLGISFKEDGTYATGSLGEKSYSSPLTNTNTPSVPVLRGVKLKDVNSGGLGYLPMHVKYGAYPQKIVDTKSEASSLEEKFKLGELKKTGNNYTFDVESKDKKPEDYSEYEDNGRRYVRVMSGKHNSCYLSSGEQVRKETAYWVEVTPIYWNLGPDGIYHTDLAMIPGITISDEKGGFEPNFKKSKLGRFLKENFSQEILQSYAFFMNKAKEQGLSSTPYIKDPSLDEEIQKDTPKKQKSEEKRTQSEKIKTSKLEKTLDGASSRGLSSLEEKAKFLDEQSKEERKNREKTVADGDKNGRKLTVKEIMQLRSIEEKKRMQANKEFSKEIWDRLKKQRPTK